MVSPLFFAGMPRMATLYMVHAAFARVLKKKDLAVFNKFFALYLYKRTNREKIMGRGCVNVVNFLDSEYIL